MNYQSIHDSIISRAFGRNLNVYTESHHILPRCMGGTDLPDNLVNLTPKEHRLIHLLLVKIYPQVTKLLWGANVMFSVSPLHGRSRGSTYAWLREQMSIAFTGSGNPMFGKKRPDLSARNSAKKGFRRNGEPLPGLKGTGRGGKGQPKSPEHRQAMSAAGKKAWILRRERLVT